MKQNRRKTKLRLKQNAKKGFSLPVSLCFFLVATMLTMVLLTAALTALKQTKLKRQDMQSFLLVSSTVDVLSKEISALQFDVDIDGKTLIPIASDSMSMAIADWYQKANDIAIAPAPAGTVLEKCFALPSPLQFQLKHGTPIEDTTVDVYVMAYAYDSGYYPGDLVLSIRKHSDEAIDTSTFATTIRIDGKFDETAKKFQFADVYYYSGSEVY